MSMLNCTYENTIKALWENEEGVNVTCSFGVASLEKPDTKETLLKRADEALTKQRKPVETRW
jgi:GGDEF domain.